MITRILVTGSRDWGDASKVAQEIEQFLRERGQMDDDVGMSTGKVTIVHGDCMTGADFWAKEWAINDWQDLEGHSYRGELGPAGGPARNQDMVDLGADVCLAFIGPCRRPGCKRPQPHGSHGATDCADRAEVAGIETRRFPAEDPPKLWRCRRPECGGHIGARCLPKA